MWRKPNAWFRYDLPEELRNVTRQGPWRGQQQKWFLMRLLGQDSDINTATEQREFTEWRWVSPDRLVELIVPFKRQLYVHILHEFTDLMEQEPLRRAEGQTETPTTTES